MTPTQRSIKLLKDEGWMVAVVEHYNSFTKRRHDLWGFADLLAVGEDGTTMYVQTTTGSNMAARVGKIAENDNARALIARGHRIVIHGWRKLKVKRGGKAVRWRAREVEMDREDFGG